MEQTNSYVQEQIQKAGNSGFVCPDAEANIIRRMITRPGVAEDTVTELAPNDFSRNEYAMIFRAIQSLVLKKTQADLITVNEEVRRLYGKEINPVVLTGIAKGSAMGIEQWQDIKDLVRLVRELSTRRQAIANIEALVGGLRDPARDISEILGEIQEVAERAVSRDGEWTGIQAMLLDTYEYIEKRQRGEIKAITTGLNGLDALIGGFYEGEMTVIAARPSVGKSAFGLNIALSAAHKGFKVGVVSCEMSAEGIGQRLISRESAVDGMKLRTADLDEQAWGKAFEAVNEMSSLPIEFLFDCMAVEDVVSAVRKRVRQGEMDMLIVDYLQFMETRKVFREERLRIGYISHMLKRLAKSAHIPVIALAQVTRQGEGAMPSMRMLRESGDIEQDADGIIFLHRPDSADDPCVYKSDRAYFNEMRDSGLTYLCIGVAKQRNGSIGQTVCTFDASIMRYAEIDRRA